MATEELDSSKIDALVGVGPTSQALEDTKVDGIVAIGPNHGAEEVTAMLAIAAIGPNHGMLEVVKIDSFTSIVAAPSLVGERIVVDEWIGPPKTPGT